MRIVITTPTGNIRSAVTRCLLDAGEKPVLIPRDPEKVEEFTEQLFRPGLAAAASVWP